MSAVYSGKHLWNRRVLSLARKSEGATDGENGGDVDDLAMCDECEGDWLLWGCDIYEP